MPEFDPQNFAKQVTEVAERVAEVSDAVRGKARRRSGGLARRLILSAAGAAVYAAAKRASADGFFRCRIPLVERWAVPGSNQ
jgi:hypothetical protein